MMGEDDDHFVVPVKRPNKPEPEPEHETEHEPEPGHHKGGGSSHSYHDDKPKHFDVAHPETTPPSPTSRPVIVSHGPMMPDPMMQAAQDDALEQDEPDRLINASRGKVVEAPAGLTAAHHEPGIEPPAPGSVHTPGSPVASDDKSETPTPPPPSASLPVTDNDDNSEALVDSVAEQAAQRKQQEEAQKEQAERSAKVADLVQRKTYYVPINVAKRRRSNQMMTVVGVALAVILIVVGVGYLLLV